MSWQARWFCCVLVAGLKQREIGVVSQRLPGEKFGDRTSAT